MSQRYKAKRRARYFRNQPDYLPPCWCGISNPYYAPIGGNCGGMGYLDCHCGGDLCVCHNHGEVECFGCADCLEQDDHFEDLYDDEHEQVN